MEKLCGPRLPVGFVRAVKSISHRFSKFAVLQPFEYTFALEKCTYENLAKVKLKKKIQKFFTKIISKFFWKFILQIHKITYKNIEKTKHNTEKNHILIKQHSAIQQQIKLLKNKNTKTKKKLNTTKLLKYYANKQQRQTKKFKKCIHTQHTHTKKLNKKIIY